MPRIPHKWHFQFTSRAEKQLEKLSATDRLRVFDSIAEILKSDDPTRVLGVRQVETRRADNIWRRRQGDYRIFFTFESGELVYQEFTYKGVVYIIAIEKHHEGY